MAVCSSLRKLNITGLEALHCMVACELTCMEGCVVKVKAYFVMVKAFQALKAPEFEGKSPVH